MLLFIGSSMKLVKRLKRFPKETIKYRPKYDGGIPRKFTLEGLLKEIVLSFYEKGRPVESTFIAKRMGLEKAEKFAYRVLRRYLGAMVDYEIEEGRERGRGFVSPLALIFISEDGKVLDFTELDEFYENLHRFSQKVEVNILKEPINLGEFLLIFKGWKEKLLKSYLNFVKWQHLALENTSSSL